MGFLVSTLCAVSSVLTSTAISVDRLLALLLGLRYRQVVTLRRTRIIAFGFWFFSIIFSSTFTVWNVVILLWYQYLGTALCLVTTAFAYTKIFCTLRHNQIHVQNHFAPRQPKQAIPLNIARYRKAVYSALWVQGTLVVLLSAAYHHDREHVRFDNSKGLFLIFLPSMAFYLYTSVLKLVIKPFAVLLEDQRD